MYRSHGESGDVDFNRITTELPILQILLSAFSRKDLFNADEFGLCFKQSPTTTIGPKRLPGRKNKYDRISFLVCTNADGSERMRPMVIGRSKKPRCFGQFLPSEYGFYNRNNKKAWMNKLLFFEWLFCFDACIGSSTGRRAILLIDNCSGHGDISTIPELYHVHVLFLPKNTTSVLQPLEAGVIAAVKKEYRKQFSTRAVDLIESGITN